MAASPKDMPSPDVRPGIQAYEIDSEGDVSSSSTSPSISRESPSSAKRLRRSSDETTNVSTTPLNLWQIFELMRAAAEEPKSYNSLKEYGWNPPFTITPYENVGHLKHEIDVFPKVIFDSRNHRGYDMYNRVRLPSDNTNRQQVYTEKQEETYRLMKMKLKEERYHVYALTGFLGTGKTSFLNQFIDDEEIDLIYVAAQHSLLKNARRKLNFASANPSITFFKLKQLLFGLSFEDCCVYQSFLNAIPMDKLHSMDLPSKFRLQVDALDQLFQIANPESIPKQRHLVVCIDDFNIINTNELYMVEGMLRRLVDATASGASVILLLSGVPNKIQPIFVPPQQNEGFEDENIDASIKLAQTTVKFEHQTLELDDQQQVYHRHLRMFGKSNNLVSDLRQAFTEAFNVREIPHKYCIEALWQIPTPCNSEMTQDDLETYRAKLAKWVSEWDQKFNHSVCYSYRNVEAHHMNLLIAISTWHQCKAFNTQASETGNEPLPLQMMPKLAPIYFVDSKDNLRKGSHQDFSEQPYLPLIIGFRYKILKTQNGVFRGEIVTLVHVEYSDFPQSCDQVSALVVISAEGDYIRITPGRFQMTLYCETISKTNRFRFFGERNVEEYGPSERLLYGFPLQLAFAKTVRGSIGPPIESKVYANLANFSEQEIYTLLANIRHPRQIQGFAATKFE